MCSGVDNNTLHQSQWAQPGRQCSDVVFMRELTLGVSKMTKTPLAGFENDASAYYDRIAMNLASAVFDRLGVPPGPVRLQEETLLRVAHCLKTGFGISTLNCTSDAIKRICGVGQSSKAGPVTWAAVSSLLFEAQDILGTGLTFQNPTCTLTHKRHSDGFVDDTTTCQALLAWLRATPTLETMFNGLLNDTQTWEQLLWTSGGLLSLEKCALWILCWKFNADGRGALMTKAELDAPPMLLTTGDTGKLQEVQQLDLHDPFKTLRTNKTISGDQQSQTTKMKNMSDACA